MKMPQATQKINAKPCWGQNNLTQPQNKTFHHRGNILYWKGTKSKSYTTGISGLMYRGALTSISFVCLWALLAIYTNLTMHYLAIVLGAAIGMALQKRTNNSKTTCRILIVLITLFASLVGMILINVILLPESLNVSLLALKNQLGIFTLVKTAFNQLSIGDVMFVCLAMLLAVQIASPIQSTKVTPDNA